MQGSSMTGKLDEISSAIGALQEGMKNIARSIDRDRDVGDRRHDENSGRLDKIERKLDPLEKTVKALEPIVVQIQTSKMKLTGAIALGSTILIAIGWIIVHAGSLAIEWITRVGR